MNSIRKVIAADIKGLEEVLDSSGLFPSTYLSAMIEDYLSNPDTEAIWFTALDEQDRIVALGYCMPEKLTNGTYNLLAIAVRKALQGKGIGHRMMHFLEDYLRQNNKRILIVETSSHPDYELTRKFYLQLDYVQMATIKDFWNDGEDKIVFWKQLN